MPHEMQMGFSAPSLSCSHSPGSGSSRTFSARLDHAETTSQVSPHLEASSLGISTDLRFCPQSHDCQRLLTTQLRLAVLPIDLRLQCGIHLSFGQSWVGHIPSLDRFFQAKPKGMLVLLTVQGSAASSL